MQKKLKQIGNNIVSIREKRVMKAYELAEKSGITPGYLSNVENGNVQRVSLQVILDIAEALNCSITEIVG